MTRPVFIPTDREGVVLRQFKPDDAPPISGLINRSREHLSQWGDDTAAKYPTVDAVIASIEHPPNPLRLRLGIWHRDPETLTRKLVGSINLTPVRPGWGNVGYWVGAPFTRQGYASCALRALIAYVLRNRPYTHLYADTRTENIASQGVLRACDFTLAAIDRRDGEQLWFQRDLDPRDAFDSVVRDLDAVGRATICVPVGEGYPHHTIVELLHEGNRIVRFFPPRNGTLVNAAYREALVRRLAQSRWQLQ